jgi:hypothetical protein
LDLILHLGSPDERLERRNLRFESGASTLRSGMLSLQRARRSTADCNWFKSVMRRSKSWSITKLGELSCWHGSSSSSRVWVIPKPVGSGVLGRASRFRLPSSSSPSFSSCFCLAICSPSPSSTLSNSCGIIIQILLALLSSDSSPPSPSQQSNFALNSVIFSDDALQHSDLLDVGCKRELSVV